MNSAFGTTLGRKYMTLGEIKKFRRIEKEMKYLMCFISRSQDYTRTEFIFFGYLDYYEGLFDITMLVNMGTISFPRKTPSYVKITSTCSLDALSIVK